MNQYFFLTRLKQINVVDRVIILMTHLAKLCVPDIFKNINVKIFNLMSRINETRQIVWRETCKCICRLTKAICNSKQIWKKDKCRCEFKEDLIIKLSCDRGYI